MLCDFRNAPLPQREKELLALIEKTALDSSSVTEADVVAVRNAGWSDEAVYDAITVCALFRFYTAWVDGCGVGALPPEGYAMSGKRLATEGYAPAQETIAAT